MKTKVFLLILVLLAAVPFSSSAQSMAVTKKAVKEVLAEVLSDTTNSVRVIRDTMIKNASQYSLDSLKYAAEIEIARLALKQKQDSAIFSNLTKDQIFELKIRENNRYYISPGEKFWREIFPVMFVTVFVIIGIYMLVVARDRGKQRSHEYRMAQIAAQVAESASDEKISDQKDSEARNNSKVEKVNVLSDKKYSPGFFSNLKNPVRYKDSGVMFILAGLAIAFLFLFSGNSNGWVLGIIPAFIGVGYLYLYYSSAQNVERRSRGEFFDKRNHYRPPYDQYSDREDQKEQQD